LVLRSYYTNDKVVGVLCVFRSPLSDKFYFLALVHNSLITEEKKYSICWYWY
jgi:hypothetical protein